MDRTSPASTGHWEHFAHDADVGIRGYGSDKEQAFEQAARGLTAIVTDSPGTEHVVAVDIACESSDIELLFFQWLNALIYEMAVRKVVFSGFAVQIQGNQLSAKAYGVPVDRLRQQLQVEPKGATLTELCVRQLPDGSWLAQCIVDV